MLLGLWSHLTYCGTDPIGWKLSQPLQNPVYTGRTYSIVYTLTNQLPVALTKSLSIIKNASPANEFNYVDECSGARLASKASCTITVILSPKTGGVKQLQLAITGYDNNQVKLSPLLTQAAESTATEVAPTVTESLPNQMKTGDATTYSFSFMNVNNATLNDVIVLITQSNGSTPIILSNSCMNGANPGTLTSGSTCTVSGSFTPNSNAPTTQSISATFTHQGSPDNPVVITTTTQVNTSPDSKNLIGSLVSPNYLPPIIEVNKSLPLQFLFTNVSTEEINFSGLHVGSITCSDNNHIDCSNALTDITSNCNTSLPSTAACELTANFTSPSTATNPVTTYTITASVPFSPGHGSPAEITTTGSVVASLPTTRTINLVNQCNFPVWFSLNGSALSGFSCDSHGNGCPTGTSCNTTTLSCYWNNPGPNNGTSYQLAPGGQSGNSNSVTIPAYNYGGIQWSGNISASTLCKGSSCAQADCNNQGGTSSCAPGKGFSQPATQAEITMSTSSTDSYDVEVINGFHLPISMEPFYYDGIPATADNYNCGTPGSFAATNNFGSCNWDNVVLPAPNHGTGVSSGYYWVTHEGTSCDVGNSSSQCPTGQLCGLYQNPTSKTFSQVCGKFLGYWSADQVCSNAGLPTAINNFFKCNQKLPTSSTPSFPINSTLYDLMACQVATGDMNPLYNSCYLSYSGYTANQIKTCCGCVDWWNSKDAHGENIKSNPTTQSCGTQIDPIWTQYIQPMIQWMKATCPSAYVYPFDDKTSGFSCTNNLPNQSNSTGYTITFCEGNTGLPANAYEGRVNN